MSHSIEAALDVLAEVQPLINLRYGGRLERLLGARSDSSDLFQAVSMKVVGSIDSFRGDTVDELKYWILGIAGNTYRSLLVANFDCQKRSMLAEGPSVGVREQYHPDGGVDPAVKAELDEQCALAMSVLDKLAPRQALALRMRFIEGKSYEETAKALECSIFAARNVVTRALIAARRELGLF